MIIPNGATVAVADGERMRLFHNTGVKPGAHLVEITASTPGHAQDGAMPRYSHASASTDGKRSAEDDFAAATASFLNKLSLDGTIEHLILISDPRTLGEMRKHFHRELKDKIIGELPKDLTGRPVKDIAAVIDSA